MPPEYTPVRLTKLMEAFPQGRERLSTRPLVVAWNLVEG
jgi:hypothetical protein